TEDRVIMGAAGEVVVAEPIRCRVVRVVEQEDPEVAPRRRSGGVVLPGAGDERDAGAVRSGRVVDLSAAEHPEPRVRVVAERVRPVEVDVVTEDEVTVTAAV